MIVKFDLHYHYRLHIRSGGGCQNVNFFDVTSKTYCRCNGNVDKILHEFISSS